MFNINRKRYFKTLEFFRHNQMCFLTLKIIYKFLPLLMFVAYPVLLVFAWFFVGDKFVKLLCVPAGVFVVVTILRKVINEQRPYEKYGTNSLFNKTTVGQSMPSRHTASAFIIAMAFLYVNYDIGITFLSVSIIITASRVLAGAHYIRDVLVGAGISIVAGYVFFFLI